MTDVETPEFVQRELVQNMRFYGNMRFKQLTLLMAGMTAAAAGFVQGEGVDIQGVPVRGLVAESSLLFISIMWIMEVRSTLQFVANRNEVPRLWPRFSAKGMRFVNATYAIMILHTVLYATWFWFGFRWMHVGFQVIFFGIGPLVFLFAAYSYCQMEKLGAAPPELVKVWPTLPSSVQTEILRLVRQDR